MTGEAVIEPVGAEDDVAALAAFAARLLRAAPEYISHGEVQVGRSPDGARWANDLEARLRAEFEAARADASADLLVVRAADGTLLGFALATWANDGGEDYGVIEDVALSEEARGGGVGARVVARIEELAAARGARWLWLESGLANEAAHRFFESLGYRRASSVFGKRL